MDIKNVDELKKKLTDIIYEDEIDDMDYWRDVYLYIDENGKGTLDIFDNPGGNSWLKDDHIKVCRLGHIEKMGIADIFQSSNWKEEMEMYMDDFSEYWKGYLDNYLEEDEEPEFWDFVDYMKSLDNGDFILRCTCRNALKDVVEYSECERRAVEYLERIIEQR